MSDRVKIEGLADVVMRGLTEYADLAAEEMKKAAKRAGDSVRKDIQANAPKDTGAYAKSWSVKKVQETSVSIGLVVHSRNRYQLAHLLEFGHAKRGGGRVPASPHIALAEAKLDETFAREIRKALGG